MSHWWVPRLQIGYEHTFIHQVADFLAGLETGQTSVPTFREAWETDRVVGAVIDPARERKCVTIDRERSTK